VSETCFCQECHKSLVTVEVEPGQRLRCGNCFHTFQYGKIEKSSTDRLAWRSFWLGIFSLFFCSFTGIPAFIFGVKSLGRMRFNNPPVGDKIAAMLGTVLGGVFGIFGGLVALIAAIAPFIYWQHFANPETPEEIEVLYAQYFDSPFPDHLIPLRGAQVLDGQSFFTFADSTESDQQTAFLYLQYNSSAAQQFSVQFNNNLQRRILPGIKSARPSEETKLNWRISDVEVPITKAIFRSDELLNPGEADNGAPPDSEVLAVQYYGVVKDRRRVFGVSMTVRYPHPYFDEDRIQQLFNSFREKEK